MQVSVVIPAHNEAENLGQLLTEVRDSLSVVGDFEIIVVDDGSSDSTPAVLEELKQQLVELRIVRHRESCGQSIALMTGVDAAVAPVIATLDGDGQNDPRDLPAMISLLNSSPQCDRLQMVAGHRQRRQDSLWRIFSSRVANGIRSRILGDRTPDSGCGIRVFLRSAFLQMPRFDHMHRFLPALIVRNGGTVVSMVVNHRPRIHGRSHYDTLRRLLYGIVDLAGAAWLMQRHRIPEVVFMDEAHDERTGVDSIRIDRATPVLRPIRRAVA